jgi:hypothetical protein
LIGVFLTFFAFLGGPGTLASPVTKNFAGETKSPLPVELELSFTDGTGSLFSIYVTIPRTIERIEAIIPKIKKMIFFRVEL